MRITPNDSGQAAGIAAATAGAIFIAVQINHPPLDLLPQSPTTDFFVCSLAKALMAMLALAGITGIYLRQVRQTGLLGLIGYLIFSVGYFPVRRRVLAAFVLPSLTDSNPLPSPTCCRSQSEELRSAALDSCSRSSRFPGIGYMLGGPIFGIALFRAGNPREVGCSVVAVRQSAPLRWRSCRSRSTGSSDFARGGRVDRSRFCGATNARLAAVSPLVKGVDRST